MATLNFCTTKHGLLVGHSTPCSICFGDIFLLNGIRVAYSWIILNIKGLNTVELYYTYSIYIYTTYIYTETYPILYSCTVGTDFDSCWYDVESDWRHESPEVGRLESSSLTICPLVKALESPHKAEGYGLPAMFRRWVGWLGVNHAVSMGIMWCQFLQVD